MGKRGFNDGKKAATPRLRESCWRFAQIRSEPRSLAWRIMIVPIFIALFDHPRLHLGFLLPPYFGVLLDFPSLMTGYRMIAFREFELFGFDCFPYS